MPGRSTLLKVIEVNARIGDANSLQEILEFPLMLDSAQSDAINSLFDQLSFGDDGVQHPDTKTDIVRHLIAAQLITVLLRANTANEGPLAPKNRKLDKLKAFLFQNMANPVTNPEMAQHLGMSRTSFCRWAQVTLGCSPARYFRQLRLERSQEWIAQDAGNLDEIANQTGFSHRYHLSREFKKYFGITPAEYRQQARNIPKAELLIQAAEHDYRHGRIQKALAACEQCLGMHPQGSIRDRARYQKGLCLRALGRGPEAMIEWSALEVSPLAHRATVQECREIFQVDHPEHALDVLKKIFDNASSDTQKRDGISLWIDQVLTLKDVHHVKSLYPYLSMRKKLFPNDHRSMPIALHVLRDLGANLDIPAHCQDLPESCFFAIRRTGKLDEALSRYGAHITPQIQHASMCLFGQYEKLLTIENALPEHKVTALNRLGRAAEAIRLYPTHAASSYLALGRYEELLAKFPEHDSEGAARTYALVALNRKDEIDKLLDNPMLCWQWFPAQLYLQPEAILTSSHPEAVAYMNRARLLIALNHLMVEHSVKAEKMLMPIDGVLAERFWWSEHTSAEILITALVRYFLGREESFLLEAQEITKLFKFRDKQDLWHDAAYLMGKISLTEYQRQPRQVWIADRTTFIQAIRLELTRRPTKAIPLYEAISKIIRYDDDSTLLRQRFAQWRLHCL